MIQFHDFLLVPYHFLKIFDDEVIFMLITILSDHRFFKERFLKFFLVVFLIFSSYMSYGNGNAITYYNYRADSIYPVKAGLGIVTQIEFPLDEEIESYATGLSDGWLLVKKENVIYLKPKNLNVDTNMIVKTTSRQYLFDLRVVSTNWKNLQEAKNAGVQYYIKFNKSKFKCWCLFSR